ncbi:MAG: flavodoxin [Ruminococcaceae bacterium]|nr:flavodoxin [Oscillospiraceae bacterium]
MSKILIVYYSRKGENYWGGSIKNLSKGNTETMAEMIQKAVGGDLFEVDTVKPYSSDYHICTEEAKGELRSNARPELRRYLDSLDGYDTIFVGYPNWWGTMPMAMFTFLEHYDLGGKKIIPFCTNEGSGMGSSEQDLKKICTGAEVKKGLTLRGSETANSESRVTEWAKKIINE